MRVSLVQSNIKWEDKELNISKAKEIVEKQAKVGSDLVLFPEMSFTGFSMNTELTGEDDNYTIKTMSGIAKNFKVSIGFGWVKMTNNKCRNVYTLIDNCGRIITSYSKIHPFSYSEEDKYFEGGNDIVTFKISDICFSCFICYDLRFPELFRVIADQVHAVIVPANWPQKRAEHWKTLLRARAIENQVYIFAINCVGDIGGQYYSGDSCIINSNGDVLEMISDKEGVITYDFRDDVEDYRIAFPVLRDRKIEVDKCLF